MEILMITSQSTFAEQLQLHFPKFHRCNQDDLGDRRRVEQLARDMLSRGKSVCIDRTNFNESQRSHWIEIAREYPGTLTWVIVFDTPYEVCVARLQSRSSHPTIKSPEQGLSVLSRFAADFQYPAAHEGHERIISLTPGDHTSLLYSRSQIAAILERVHNSPPVMAHNNSFQSFRGNFLQGDSIHSNFGPCDVRIPRGRGDVVVGSLNKDWRSSPGCTSHFIDQTRNTAIRSLSHVTVVDGYGAGMAEDPFKL